MALLTWHIKFDVFGYNEHNQPNVQFRKFGLSVDDGTGTRPPTTAEIDENVMVAKAALYAVCAVLTNLEGFKGENEFHVRAAPTIRGRFEAVVFVKDENGRVAFRAQGNSAFEAVDGIVQRAGRTLTSRRWSLS